MGFAGWWRLIMFTMLLMMKWMCFRISSNRNVDTKRPKTYATWILDVGFPSHPRLMHEHLPFKNNTIEDTWIINRTAWIWIDFTSTTGIQMVSFTPIGDFKHFSCHFYGLGWQQPPKIPPKKPRVVWSFLMNKQFRPHAFHSHHFTRVVKRNESSAKICISEAPNEGSVWNHESIFVVSMRTYQPFKVQNPLVGIVKAPEKKTDLVLKRFFLEVLWKWMLACTLHLIRWR